MSEHTCPICDSGGARQPTWPDSGSIDPHDYTSAECFVAGRLSTMPPFASEFSPRALPFARAALEAMGDWIPDE